MPTRIPRPTTSCHTRTRAFATLCAVALLGPLYVATDEGADASTRRVTADAADAAEPVGRWSAVWMSNVRTVTDAEARALGRRFEILIGHSFTLASRVDAIHAANPRTDVLAYINGMWAKPDAYPSNWYAKDARGRRVAWTGWGTQLLLPSLAWARSLADRCEAAVASGFDGCLLDNMGPGSVERHADQTGIPINPGTGEQYTRREWLQATAAVSSVVRQRVPSARLVANGATNGGAYFHQSGPTSLMLPPVDGLMIEAFARAATWSVRGYLPPKNWRADVDMLRAIERNGKSALAITKLWTMATPAEQDAWYRYSLGTFLLGSNGSSYFQFLRKKDVASVMNASGPSARLGDPSGPYRHVGRTFVRNFARGIVIVNPTSEYARYQLAGQYVDLNGRSRSGALQLRPHGAQILITQS